MISIASMLDQTFGPKLLQAIIGNVHVLWMILIFSDDEADVDSEGHDASSTLLCKRLFFFNRSCWHCLYINALYLLLKFSPEKDSQQTYQFKFEKCDWLLPGCCDGIHSDLFASGGKVIDRHGSRLSQEYCNWNLFDLHDRIPFGQKHKCSPEPCEFQIRQGCIFVRAQLAL